MQNQEIAINKKVAIHFTVLTFCIAYSMSGVLIVLGTHGYSVYNWVSSVPQFIMNVPFSLYILSPALASYLVLRWNKQTNLREWMKTVFYIKNSIFLYLYVCAVLMIYFLVHALLSNRWVTELPFYIFFLSLPGSLMIGGLEEAGWSYILQPSLKKRYGFAVSSIIIGIIWVLWHIPLFFIPGTNHG